MDPPNRYRWGDYQKVPDFMIARTKWAGYAPMDARARHWLRTASKAQLLAYDRIGNTFWPPPPPRGKSFRDVLRAQAATRIQRWFRSKTLDRLHGGPRLFRRVKALNRKTRFIRTMKK